MTVSTTTLIINRKWMITGSGSDW